MGTGAAIIIGSLIAAGGAVAASELAPDPPDIPELPQPPEDPTIVAKRLAEQRRRKAGTGGRASTIMSGSPLGVPGSGGGGGRGASLTGGGGY